MKDLNCMDCKNIANEPYEGQCLNCIEYSNFYPVDIS